MAFPGQNVGRRRLPAGISGASAILAAALSGAALWSWLCLPGAIAGSGGRSPHRAPAAVPESPPADNAVSRVVTAWLKHPLLQQSEIGVEVLELPSGRVLYSLNGSRRFTPASTAKIFTTACALETMGQDFRYHTRLEAYGPVRNGRLDGDLVLVPSQDPTFESRDLWELLSVLGQKKIKAVEGRVILSPVAGGRDQFNTGWLLEDWGQEWMPVSSNLVLDRNIAPGKDPGRGLPVDDRRAGEPNTLIESLLSSSLAPAWVSLDPASRKVRVHRGGSPAVSSAGSLVVANPCDYNLAAVASVLKGMGIRVNGHAPLLPDSKQPVPLSEHVSQPVTEIIRQCLKDSDNLYAQQLLRTIGAKTRAETTPDAVSLEDSGLACLGAWLAGIGVRQSDVVLVDGCGLSRKDCVTPHALNLVLKHMAGPDLAGTYLGLLRLEGNKAGWFRSKTGAMDCVRSVAGIMHTAGGGNLAVTVMVNGHTPSVGPLRSAILELTGRLESLPLLKSPAG